MAIVTGYTAEKMNEINETTVVSGAVNTAGSLILKTRGGANIDAGRVKGLDGKDGAKGDKGDTGTITTAQLDPFVPRWKAGTAYTVGKQVISPTNMVMSANVAHTASAAFATDVDKWDGTARDIPYGHMGRTAGFQDLTTNTPIVMNAAQELRGGMTYDNAANALVLPVTGRYLINLKGFFSGGMSNINQVGILINGDPDLNGVSQKLTASGSKASSADIAVTSSGILYLSKGTKIAVCQTSSVSAWGVTGYNGTCIEILYLGA